MPAARSCLRSPARVSVVSVGRRPWAVGRRQLHSLERINTNNYTHGKNPTTTLTAKIRTTHGKNPTTTLTPKRLHSRLYNHTYGSTTALTPHSTTTLTPGLKTATLAPRLKTTLTEHTCTCARTHLLRYACSDTCHGLPPAEPLLVSHPRNLHDQPAPVCPRLRHRRLTLCPLALGQALEAAASRRWARAAGTVHRR